MITTHDVSNSDKNSHQRRHDFQSVRSNSLPSSCVDATEMNRMWEVFWASSGEQLIWSSWIEKFGEFINPEYSAKVNEKSDEEQRPSDFIENQTETEIRISSCSPAANPEVNYTASDHLLSPRCESVTSSIPITIATTDSMTNVTHLTLSSGDFGQLRGDANNFQSESESLNSSDMLTSSSSTSSQSPEDEMTNGEDAEAKVLADLCTSGNGGSDDAMDSDQHWQILWQKHFQEQYTEQYRQFMESKRAELLSGSSVPESSFDEVPIPSASNRRSSRKQRRIAAAAEVELPDMVSGLNIADGGETEVYDGEGNAKTTNGDGPPEEVNNAEINAMASMGLPTSFGSSKPAGGSGDGNRNPNEKSVTLKRGYVFLSLIYLIYLTGLLGYFWTF